MKQHLFRHLGITDAGWIAAPSGAGVGYGQMWLKPHDMAKIGWLYLNDGRWDGQQIISQKWVADSTRKHINATLFDGYGYQWWVSYDRFYAAVGHRGQFIYVLPKQSLVVVFTSSLKESDFFIPEKLLDTYILPAVVSQADSTEDPEQAARLAALIKEGTDSVPYVWQTTAEGMAVDGIFARSAEPAFKFTYPAGCSKSDLDPRLPQQIMSMKTLDEDSLTAFVVDVKAQVDLKDFGPKFYLPKFQAFAPSAGDIKIISNEQIALKGNVAAYRIDISYNYGRWPFNLHVVVAQRGNKFVYVAASGWAGRSLEDEIRAAESLSFE